MNPLVANLMFNFSKLVCMMRLTRVDFFSICDSAPVPFVGVKGTKNVFCALALFGTVLGASCAENLKIHPEFLPSDLNI